MPRDSAARPSRREQNKQANRAAILAAARACFLEVGFDACTVRDVVRRTSLAIGTFYNYFRTKEELFKAILDEGIGALNTAMHRVRAQAADPSAFIHGAYREVFRAVATDPDFFRLLLRNEPAVRAHFSDTVLGLPLRTLRADIRDAVARGVLPPIDDELLAAAFYGIGFEMMRTLLSRRRFEPEAAAKFASRLVTEGIESFRPTGRPRRA